MLAAAAWCSQHAGGAWYISWVGVSIMALLLVVLQLFLEHPHHTGVQVLAFHMRFNSVAGCVVHISMCIRGLSISSLVYNWYAIIAVSPSGECASSACFFLRGADIIAKLQSWQWAGYLLVGCIHHCQHEHLTIGTSLVPRSLHCQFLLHLVFRFRQKVWYRSST